MGKMMNKKVRSLESVVLRSGGIGGVGDGSLDRIKNENNLLKIQMGILKDKELESSKLIS